MDERTLVLIKYPGVKRCLVGEVLRRFERKGYKLVAMKFQSARKDQSPTKISDDGPVVPMVFEGIKVVESARKLAGNPELFYAAESVESADQEIKQWFNDDEIVCYKQFMHPQLYE